MSVGFWTSHSKYAYQDSTIKQSDAMNFCNVEADDADIFGRTLVRYEVMHGSKAMTALTASHLAELDAGNAGERAVVEQVRGSLLQDRVSKLAAPLRGSLPRVYRLFGTRLEHELSASTASSDVSQQIDATSATHNPLAREVAPA